jgi:hypothetical protein
MDCPVNGLIICYLHTTTHALSNLKLITISKLLGNLKVAKDFRRGFVPTMYSQGAQTLSNNLFPRTANSIE